MTDASHTTEHWVLRGRDPDAEHPSGFLPPHYWSVWASDGRIVATFPRLIEERQAEQARDAFTIVAAPALLAACRTARDALGHERLVLLASYTNHVDGSLDEDGVRELAPLDLAIEQLDAAITAAESAP